MILELLMLGLSSDIYSVIPKSHAITVFRISSWSKWTGIGEGVGEKFSTVEEAVVEVFTVLHVWLVDQATVKLVYLKCHWLSCKSVKKFNTLIF